MKNDSARKFLKVAGILNFVFCIFLLLAFLGPIISQNYETYQIIPLIVITVLFGLILISVPVVLGIVSLKYSKRDNKLTEKKSGVLVLGIITVICNFPAGIFALVAYSKISDDVIQPVQPVQPAQPVQPKEPNQF